LAYLLIEINGLGGRCKLRGCATRHLEKDQRAHRQAKLMSNYKAWMLFGYCRSSTNGQSTFSKLEAKSTELQKHSTSNGLYIRSFQYLKMISPRSDNYEHLEGGLGQQDCRAEEVRMEKVCGRCSGHNRPGVFLWPEAIENFTLENRPTSLR